MEMEILQNGGVGAQQEHTNSLTIQVTQDQEAAMEAFFQINSWTLYKESRGSVTGNEGVHSLTIQVTTEQEAAVEAFFQINNWMLVKEVDSTNIHEDTDSIAIDSEGQLIQEELVEQVTEADLGTLVEEVQGLHEIQVTAAGANGQPQIITVYTEGGHAQGIPESLLTEGDDQGGSVRVPQVIIQEITLPEGMSLDQGLVIANPQPVIRRVTPRGSVKPGDKINKCHVCGKTFKQTQSFNGHYQSHFGAKPYQCTICNTGFTLKAALVAHHSIHTGAKPFQCTMCDKGFRRKDDMISHIRTHTGEKPYECDICGKKFKYRNQIPKHRRAHTGEKPYKCTHCEKAFTSNIHLRRHERTHTGERPYKCTVCPKAFTQFGHLQAHNRIHTDERPYPCSICGRGFREKKVMKKHETLHTSERPYKCTDCGKGFLRQSNLELHAVMHQKERGEGGKVRPRPKPKPKKRQADAEMREFVANVLSNVRKVDSSMQTESLVHGVPEQTTSTQGADNLSAFVDFAVEQQSQQGNKMEPITELQNVSGEEQYTLVMQDDGSEGYLISNYDSNTVTEEIVTMATQQVEISTAYGAEAGQPGTVTIDNVTYTANASDIVSKALEKAVASSNTDDEDENFDEQAVQEIVSNNAQIQNSDSSYTDIKNEGGIKLENLCENGQGDVVKTEGEGHLECELDMDTSQGDSINNHPGLGEEIVSETQTATCKIMVVK